MSNRITLLAPLTFAAAAWGQQTCEKLTTLKLPHTEIVSASVRSAEKVAHEFGGPPSIDVPARCVVKAVARPTKDSEIKLEVWLPLQANWNGKYMQAGNAGWAGRIPNSTLSRAIQRGYATAGTNGGHDYEDAMPAGWAIGHPEKLIDFGYRALRETTLVAKAVMDAFYGKPAARSYFFGCSDGGREGLMEAQRYPEDFDGIIAGAPANNWSGMCAGFVWNEQALLNDPASVIPPSKLVAIQKAALAACDANDGVKDGLIENPRSCRFDPATLTCAGAENAECLTATQVAALKKIYEGPRNSRTGQQIFPGYPPGHEAIPGGWRPWIINARQEASIQISFGNSFFGQAVFETPKWDFRTLNFDGDIAFALEKAGAALNSTNPDLRSFRARGGKLIQYHGWADAAIAPTSSIEYYEKVRAFFAKYPDPRGSGGVDGFYRLFMVPGLGHCFGGIGANSFGNDDDKFGGDPERDVISALERWVEKGVAPDRLIGTGKAPADATKTMTRLLCPYPQVAQYKGTGDSNLATSFTCGAGQP